ncbi:MAG: NAD(P)-binding protein, partial [Bacteroidia bacterium]|nr:NAD(P)-binding protein [Bacteroidia bacterium]
MLSRRKFLRYTLSGLAGITLTKCIPAKNASEINIRFKPDNSGRAHQLRDAKQQFKTGETIYKEVVIVGAGISGLSAGYNLKNKGIHNFTIYELGEKAGGNSGSGKNALSEYPHGAHYLTMPNPANKELMAFLNEQGIIKSFDEKGRPVFNETDLCFDPEERLYIRGVFQEGLVPEYGLSKEEKLETKLFFDWIKIFKEKKGSDGKYFFEMPCALASTDKDFDFLDKITFEKYLAQNNFTSPHLLWYLNYCCRDDYGGGIARVSAWAGINYFASHRAEPANTDASRILTWPEGNGYLVKLFEKKLSNHITTSCLVESISIVNDNVELLVKNFTNNTITRVLCKQCVLAVPPFVVAKILSPQLNYPVELTKQLEHSPWLVATVMLSHLDANKQSPLCWDN